MADTGVKANELVHALFNTKEEGKRVNSPNIIYDALTGVHVDHETGEIIENDESAMNEIIAGLKTKEKVIIEHIAFELKKTQAFTDFLKSEEKRIYKDRKTIEDRLLRAKTNIIKILEYNGQRVAEGHTSKLKVNYSKRLLLTCEAHQLPEEYQTITTTIEPNKVHLKAALKDGVDIPDVEIKEFKSLTIR